MIQASVVVPTCRPTESLRRCLDALLSQSLAREAYEIVVVPYGPAGANEAVTLPRTEQRICSILPVSQNLPAAMNSAIRTAGGKIVIFVSEDCICDAGLIAAHLEAHERGDSLVVHGPTWLHPECPRTTVTTLEMEARQRAIRCEAEGIRPSGLVLRTNCSVSKGLLETHAFDETCGDTASVELLTRLLYAGARVRYASAALAYQFCDKTARDLIVEARDLSAFEVTLAKKAPQYRGMSSIARWSSDRIHRRVARRIIALAPFSIDPALALLSAIVHPFSGYGPFLQLSRRLLRLRIETAATRAAVSAASSWAQLNAVFLRRVPILLYHNVISDAETSPNRFTMSQSVFERQMQWLSEGGYRGISISDFLAWREANAPLPPKPVLITFDDAYDDAARYAFPVLEKFGFPAACMVVTDEIAKTNRWDLTRSQRPLKLMDEETLLEWGQRGIGYGAHSCSHPDLRTLGDSELWNELISSRRALEEILQSPVRTFAYPYGFLDRRVRDQTGRIYDLAFTTVPRPSHLATDPLLLGRMEPEPSDTRFDLVSRLRWGWSPRLRVKAALTDFRSTGARILRKRLADISLRTD